MKLKDVIKIKRYLEWEFLIKPFYSKDLKVSSYLAERFQVGRIVEASEVFNESINGISIGCNDTSDTYYVEIMLQEKREEEIKNILNSLANLHEFP